MHPLLAQKIPEYLWGKNIGGVDVAMDNAGNLFTVGVFSDTITQNNQTYISRGGSDIILTKTENNGVIIWQKRLGGGNSDFAGRIRCDEGDNVYVSGRFYSWTIIDSDTFYSNNTSLFVTKFSPSGNVFWTRTFDNLGDNSLNNIAVDNHENVYIGMPVYIQPADTLTVGLQKFVSRGNNDILIIKLNSAGNITWAKQEGGLNRDGIVGIATDKYGSIYTTGYFSDSAYFGNTLIPDASTANIFLAKYDSSGILQFITTPQKGNGTGFDVVADESGYIYQCGQINDTAIFGNHSLFTSSTASFLTKYDNVGNVIWAKKYPYNIHHHALRMAMGDSNEIYVNIVYGIASLVKYGSDGNIIWSNEYGPQPEAPSVMGVCADKAGNVFFTGTCNKQSNVYGNDTITIGQNPPYANFLAKVGPFPASIAASGTAKKTVLLYPNPNSGNFIVRGNSLSRYKNYDVISLTGQSVASGHLRPAGNAAQISTGLLPEGIYILRLSGESSRASLTFRIE